MKNEFVIFRTFSQLDQFIAINSLLQEHDIETLTSEDKPPVDISFTGAAEMHKRYEIRIRSTDFKLAEKVIEGNTIISMEDVPKDYYLLTFSNEELYDVLLKADEWSKYDEILAQKLLQERGKTIDSALIKSLAKQRKQDLSKPEENQEAWIFAGYLLAFAGGLLGIVIGYVLWTSKKTLPDGDRIYTYSTSDRRHGKNIFIISVIAFPLAIVLRIIL